MSQIPAPVMPRYTASIRITLAKNDPGTHKVISEEVDVTLECKECEHTDFEVHNSGYAYYMSYVNINPDDPTDTCFHDGETEVGDDFDCDWEWKCSNCGQYCDSRLSQALKVFSRIRQAKPEDQLAAYIGQVLFRPLTDEKKQLLDRLKGAMVQVHDKYKIGKES